jgi:hypothetical protein
MILNLYKVQKNTIIKRETGEVVRCFYNIVRLRNSVLEKYCLTSRGCQRSARKTGLKIIYIDPEGYMDGDNFISYPLESPQDDDLVIRLKADDI